MRIDPLIRALQNYLDIFHHMCSMDPLASKTLIHYVRTVKQLLKGEIAENEHLVGIYDLYKQATAEIEKKEKDKEEYEKRSVK